MPLKAVWVVYYKLFSFKALKLNKIVTFGSGIILCYAYVNKLLYLKR